MGEQSRIHGLDMWRASLLLLGPIVHGSPSTIGARVQWMEVITQSSHLFRMEAFFAVSGYLMIYLDCANRIGWLATRMKQLLLPVAATWLLLNIPAIIFVRWWDGTVMSAADPLHLWFLIDLAVGTVLVCWLARRSLLVVHRHRLTWVAIWLAMAVVTQALLYKLHGDDPLVNLVTGLPYYTCFLVAGAMAAANPTTAHWLRTTRFWWIGLPVLVGGLLVFSAGYALLVDPARDERHTLFRLAYEVITVLCAACMMITVLATALRLRREHQLFRKISRSSYTIYLVHMAMVLVLAKLFMSLPPAPRFAVVVAVSLVISWSFHRFVVERWALAALAFNGRALPHGHWARSAWGNMVHAGSVVVSHIR